MPKITPFLWFDTQAEEAMNLYASIFKRSKVISVNRAQGRVMSVQFELEGQPFMALNAGPIYKFNEAVSFFVGCETQEEIDELWAKLIADGGAPKPVRLAEGQVRAVVADHANCPDPDAGRQGRREIGPRHERHAPDEQARPEAAAGGVRRKVRDGPIIVAGNQYRSITVALVSPCYRRTRTFDAGRPPLGQAPPASVEWPSDKWSHLRSPTAASIRPARTGSRPSRWSSSMPARWRRSSTETTARSSPPLVLYVVAGMLGIGMGYHRLLTHRAYKTPKSVEYFLTWCATLALEGGPIFWVATHRIHHQHSDREGDPHTPREGTWWAHMGWIVTGEGMHRNAVHARALRAGPRFAIASTSRCPDGTGRRTSSSASRCWRTAASRMCCGGSSSAPRPACTAPGW